MKSEAMRNHFITLKRYTPFSGNGSLAGFFVAVAVVFLCFACDNTEQATQIVTSAEEAVERLPQGEGLDIGALAPDFSIPDSSGDAHNLSQYRGQKLVIVFYRMGT